MFKKLKCTAIAYFDLAADGPVLISEGGSNKPDPTRPDNTFQTGWVGKDHNAKAYVIPGSAIKGVIRHRMYDLLNDREVESIFGKIRKEEVQKSKIKFNDAFADMNTIITAVRHSTAIDPFTQSAKKGSLRDMEVVESGIFKAGFIFNNYKKKEMEKLLLALSDVNSGMVHFGGQVSRGFGKMCINNFSMKVNSGYNEDLVSIGKMEFNSLDEAVKYFGKAE